MPWKNCCFELAQKESAKNAVLGRLVAYCDKKNILGWQKYSEKKILRKKNFTMFWLEKCFTMFWLEKLNQQRANNAFLGQLVAFFWQTNIIGEQKYSLKKILRKNIFYNILAWKMFYNVLAWKMIYNVLAWKMIYNVLAWKTE